MGAPTAILFPGQGSHEPGMRSAVERHAPELAAVAAEAVGESPFERSAESTRFAQPAILCASLAAWTAAGRPAAEAFAGHSLGEIGALVAAGSLDAADAVRLAATRGRLTDEVVLGGAGGMVALRCGLAEARGIAAAAGVAVANDNSPSQVVVSGPRVALEQVADLAGERRVRARLLGVEGAFHSPAMESAVVPFEAELERIRFRTPEAVVISSIAVAELSDPDEIRAALAAALTSPVRWRETLELMHDRGIREYRETGPGRVLTGLARRTLDDVSAGALGEAG